MQYSTKKLAEHKLIILHLLQKMGISLSNSEICQFLLEKNYMDYFSVQQYLAELESAGWLEKTREQNNTRYTLTDDGEEVINYFINRISDEVKNEINVYVHENSRRIRAEYAVTANYFPELNGDYLVKCSLTATSSPLWQPKPPRTKPNQIHKNPTDSSSVGFFYSLSSFLKKH